MRNGHFPPFGPQSPSRWGDERVNYLVARDGTDGYGRIAAVVSQCQIREGDANVLWLHFTTGADGSCRLVANVEIDRNQVAPLANLIDNGQLFTTRDATLREMIRKAKEDSTRLRTCERVWLCFKLGRVDDRDLVRAATLAALAVPASFVEAHAFVYDEPAPIQSGDLAANRKRFEMHGVIEVDADRAAALIKALDGLRYTHGFDTAHASPIPRRASKAV